MGNTITMNPQMKESIKEAYTDDKQIFDKIFEKSKAIYSRNKEQLSDKDLYDRLVINYSNQLYKIPLEKIETIYAQVEGQSTVRNELKPFLELSLKYDGLEEEKYIVNLLIGKLLENFKDNKIPSEVERNGIKLKLPDLYYIHNKVALLLDGVQQRENNKLEKQSGGILFSPLALSNDGQLPSNSIRNPEIINKINKNKRGGFPMNNFNNGNNGYNGNSENYRSSSNNENNENGSYENKKKKLSIQRNKPKSQSQSQPPYQKKSLSSLEKELEEFETKTENNKKNNKKNNENTVAPIQATPPPLPETPPAPKSRPVIVPDEDNLCTDPNLPCKLTKMEMCVKIVMNLMIRNNIILAILSTIPIKNQNGDYEGSFTFERLTSLKKGRFCAPSPLSHVQDEEDDVRIHKIMRFLNMMDDETCKKSGGHLFQLTEKQMQDMLADQTFGKKYFEYGNKINAIYQESIRILLTILEKLESNFIISTNELNEISASVKNTIDELYIKTQFNFLLAVLVVMDFDFSKNPVKDMKIQERRRKISEGIFK